MFPELKLNYDFGNNKISSTKALYELKKMPHTQNRSFLQQFSSEPSLQSTFPSHRLKPERQDPLLVQINSLARQEFAAWQN